MFGPARAVNMGMDATTHAPAPEGAPATERPTTRWSPGFWLKLLVSLAMLGAVITVSRPGEILGVLMRADGRWVLAAAVMWLAVQGLYVGKWCLLNRAQGLHTPFKALWEVYLVGTYFNLFLPAGLGGDAVRAYRLARLSGRAGASLASVAVDRFTSLYALLLVATWALFAAPADWRVLPPGLLVALDVAGALAFVVWLQAGWWRGLGGWAPLARWPRVGAAIAQMAEAAVRLRRAPGPFALALVLSVVYQVLAVVLHHWLMLALGLPVGLGYAMVFVPLLTLALSVPVSLNGLGVREGGFAFFLVRLGIEPSAGVAVGLMSLGLVLTSAAWGAVLATRSASGRAPTGGHGVE
jgi:uncharacterized membrane protein YbhN (UPF0104 family)